MRMILWVSLLAFVMVAGLNACGSKEVVVEKSSYEEWLESVPPEQREEVKKRQEAAQQEMEGMLQMMNEATEPGQEAQPE